MRTRTIHLRIIDDTADTLARRALQIGISITSYCSLVLTAAASGEIDRHIIDHITEMQKSGAKKSSDKIDGG